MRTAKIPDFRLPLEACIGGIITARRKCAPLWQICRIWHQTVYWLQLALSVLYIRKRIKQPLCVRMFCMIEHLIQIPFFNDSASIHNGYPVASFRHNS